MRTYVFILPLLVACGFEANPLDSDHGDLDPRTFTSEGVVTVRGRDPIIKAKPDSGSAGTAGESAPAPDASTFEPDAAPELDAMEPEPEPDAAVIVPVPDAGAPDATTPLVDAMVPQPDATVPEPDAAMPEPDAAVKPPDYTDETICQWPCSASAPCGPQSVCTETTTGSSVCLPRAPVGKSCADVCRGYLPTRVGEVCKSTDPVASCIVVMTARACWN